jgi:large subunit ribosomal protein L24
MKVKVGDNVKILAGKDKGKEGRIIRTLKKDNKVVVEGINMIKKHVKPNRMNEVGSIVDIEAPIHVSNVKLVETKKETKKEAKKATAKPVEEKTTKKTTKKSEKKAS